MWQYLSHLIYFIELKFVSWRNNCKYLRKSLKCLLDRGRHFLLKHCCHMSFLATQARDLLLRIWFLFRGGSRTSPRRGRQSLGGRLPNILVIFSEKPYEIKEILVHRGARAGCGPLNPPLLLILPRNHPLHYKLHIVFLNKRHYCAEQCGEYLRCRQL